MIVQNHAFVSRAVHMTTAVTRTCIYETAHKILVFILTPRQACVIGHSRLACTENGYE